MLDASDQITANRKNVCEERIFCVFNSISVTDDRYREWSNSCTRFKFGVPSHCNVNDYGSIASGVEQVVRRVPDSQFAKRKIAPNKNQTQARCDEQSAFHVDSCNEP